jgi:hypothetical protein
MFYTYLWLREDGTPFYVGKGKSDRAYTQQGHKFKVPPDERIVIHPAESEYDAFETEIDLIWYYGRKDLSLGCLRNFTNGGDGPSGAVRSAYTKQKLREANLGKPQTEETKRKRASSLKGKPWSETKRHSNRKQPRVIPVCHPDRKHKGNGLCKACHYKEWLRKNGPRKKETHGTSREH